LIIGLNTFSGLTLLKMTLGQIAPAQHLPVEIQNLTLAGTMVIVASFFSFVSTITAVYNSLS
jgi:hypothetical protein